MTETRPPSSFTRTHAWALTCTLIIFSSGALWVAAAKGIASPQHLAWRPDLWLTAPWTLWTAPLEHFVLPHAIANTLALASLAVLGSLVSAQARDALALILAWPLSTLGLLLWPEVGGYYGLSGVVHAAAAVLTIRALASPTTLRIGQWMAIGLLFKLALERGWSMPIGFESSWGFNVVFAAHLTGAVAGATMALIVQAMEIIQLRPGGR
ncbi:rhomboid family intramembrane serine protease [Ottowia thiooxydans]|uniref:rhomboid family intramembrane serine protease n=1 Tax=Ottowia thiooxydans TaxID=219182 RepID=UPI0006851247|nr:rhomboid family intramembrane serine protease [Ottowia thiooxydans]